MKKIGMFLLLALLAGPKLGWTATPTPTPNQTATAAQTQIQQTQTAIAATATYIATAFPTQTPTQTPTGTLTPSATFTPSPKQLKDNEAFRVYFIPSDLTQADGATALSNTALPGSSQAWMAQSLSQSVAVLSTGSAEVRQSMTIPWNYRGRARFFAILGNQSNGDSVTLTCSVNGQRFNCTTQTVGTYSYTPPMGGNYYLPGIAANVIAGVQGVAPLWNGSATGPQVVSRVMMPLPASCYNWATVNPTLATTLNPGDIVNFDIKRTSGGAGNVFIYALEFEYAGNSGLPM